MAQFLALGLLHALHGHSGEPRHHLCHVGRRHLWPFGVVALLQSACYFLELLLEVEFPVAVAGGKFEVLVGHGLALLGLCLVYACL